MADKVTIEVRDEAARQLLDRITQKAGHPGQALKEIGENQAEKIKQRFKSSTGPDGNQWAENQPSTLTNYIRQKGGKRAYKKNGELSKYGEKLVAHKKPLIGETQQLSTQIYYALFGGDTELHLGSTREQAAMMQFGGKKTDYPHLWGDIPARPFMPVKSDGTLYEDDRREIQQELTDYYAKLFGG